jgi:hypothetical protein
MAGSTQRRSSPERRAEVVTAVHHARVPTGRTDTDRIAGVLLGVAVAGLRGDDLPALAAEIVQRHDPGRDH